MKLVIFSEAGFEHGFGHFYRMSGVCEKAVAEHKQVEMYLVADDAARSNLDWSYVRFADWHNPTIYESILDKDVTLVVDSYHVDMALLEVFQRLSADMIVVDDNVRLDYRGMKILNPNYYAAASDYPEGKGNTLFVGGEYTLLRNGFELKGSRTVKTQVSDILVTMGGTDPRGLTVEAISAIKEASTTARIHAVCTAAYHNLEEVQNSLDGKDTLYTNINASGMAELMRVCDFAVASAGQTTNELIKMQCPAVLVAIVDNQLLSTTFLANEGCIEAIFYDGEMTGRARGTIQSMFGKNKRASMVEKQRVFESEKTGKDLIFKIAFGEK